jgi:hypothetical protein
MHRSKDNIDMYIKETGWCGLGLSGSGTRFYKGREFIE